MAIKSILGGKSKNLFDMGKANITVKDGVFVSNVGVNTNFYALSVEPEQTYTISCDTRAVTGAGVQLQLSCQTERSYTKGTRLFSFLTSREMIADWVHINKTFTVPADVTQVYFSTLMNAKYFRNFQIELGSAETEYVPYEITSYKSIMKVSDVCQLVDKSKIPTTQTVSGVTFTNNADGSVTVNGTSTHQHYSEIVIPIDGLLFIPGHVYLNGTNKGNAASFVNLYGQITKDYNMYPQLINTLPSGKDFYKFRYIIRVIAGATVDNCTCTPQLFDLTKMFGAGNEPKTVAEFKAKFPNDYYPYSPACFVTSFDERMPCKTKNLFGSSTEVGVPSSTAFTNTTKRVLEDGKWYIGLIRNNYYNPLSVVKYDIGDNYVNVINKSSYGVAKCIYVEPNTNYTVTLKLKLVYGTNSETGIGFYQEDGTQISFMSDVTSLIHRFTTPENCKFITITFCSTGNGQSVFSDIQIEKGSTATDYVPYGYV